MRKNHVIEAMLASKTRREEGRGKECYSTLQRAYRGGQTLADGTNWAAPNRDTTAAAYSTTAQCDCAQFICPSLALCPLLPCFLLFGSHPRSQHFLGVPVCTIFSYMMAYALSHNLQ